MFIKSRSILLFLPMLIAVGLACNQPTNGTNKNSSQDNVIAVIDSSSPVVTKVQVMATTSIVADWVKQVGGDRIYVDSVVPDSVKPTHLSTRCKRCCQDYTSETNFCRRINV